MRQYFSNLRPVFFVLFVLGFLCLVFKLYTLTCLLVSILQIIKYKNSQNNIDKIKEKRILITMIFILPFVFLLDYCPSVLLQIVQLISPQ
jgi:hypothetical protein